MKFFHPQIQLARETVLDEPNAYYLHVVTFCPNTSFRADGFSIIETHLSEGRLEVAVKLRKDPSLPNMNYITPVVHTINLGSVAFPDEEGDIEVQVEVEGVESTGSGTRGDTTPTKTGGKGTVSTTTADNKSKPFFDDLF